jgi:hypothetical protein
VIGEYFYDPKVYKNKREYVFNGLFFMEQLSKTAKILKERFTHAVHTDALQMIQDAYKRIPGNPHLHFEVSTNEIINEKSLKELWYALKRREYDDVLQFCRRLHAKISTLGKNYRVMLNEQIQRYSAERR